MISDVVDGWICVGLISSDSRKHINEDAVKNVKLSDDEINSLRSDAYYNFKIVADDFLKPKNDWVQYPYTLYLTNDYVSSSVKNADEIEYSNRISLSLATDPIDIYQKKGSIGLGCGNCGDTFFSYGAVDEDRMGLYQSFSGFGSGSIWIR